MCVHCMYSTCSNAVCMHCDYTQFSMFNCPLSVLSPGEDPGESSMFSMFTDLNVQLSSLSAPPGEVSASMSAYVTVYVCVCVCGVCNR